MNPWLVRARSNKWDDEFPVFDLFALGVESSKMENGPAPITYKEPPKLEVPDSCLTVESEHNRVMAKRTGQDPGLIVLSDVWG